jgi:hypothetical protein
MDIMPQFPRARAEWRIVAGATNADIIPRLIIPLDGAVAQTAQACSTIRINALAQAGYSTLRRGLAKKQSL